MDRSSAKKRIGPTTLSNIERALTPQGCPQRILRQQWPLLLLHRRAFLAIALSEGVCPRLRARNAGHALGQSNRTPSRAYPT